MSTFYGKTTPSKLIIKEAVDQDLDTKPNINNTGDNMPPNKKAPATHCKSAFLRLHCPSKVVVK